MLYIDLHCDALMKFLLYPEQMFNASEKIDVTLEQLINSDCRLQIFAIYIPEDYPQTISTFLQMVDIFYQKVLKYPQIHWVRTQADLEACFKTGKIGVMLSIEGVECLEANLFMSSITNQLGIGAIGLTWNRQNWAAEGVLAHTNIGLTHLGRQFINLMQMNNTILDVSHLSIKSFDDVLASYEGPIWASHSNSYSVCQHPRNLNDNQIKTLINRNALIGITYVPQFIKEQGQVNIDDLLKHIDHILSLGGAGNIALGSDFDGIEDYVQHLSKPLDVKLLINSIEQKYGYELAEAIAWKNAYTFLQNHLK